MWFLCFPLKLRNAKKSKWRGDKSKHPDCFSKQKTWKSFSVRGWRLPRKFYHGVSTWREMFRKRWRKGMKSKVFSKAWSSRNYLLTSLGLYKNERGWVCRGETITQFHPTSCSLFAKHKIGCYVIENGVSHWLRFPVRKSLDCRSC